ncbi:MAG: ABC transporter ATP-binding protein [Actinobacteria bacterium]|nr:ABC transporter ATP-binding protein [Actinomycetota bacterium]
MQGVAATSRAQFLAACRDVTVRYGSCEAAVIALDQVDIALLPGETVALWGPSGSGKTTLLHVLGGLVEPSDGVVVWEGSPLSTLDTSARARARARGIAYVFQGSNLLPAFSAYENVAFAAYVAGERSSVERHAVELLALVGLQGKADNLPAELSGGEAQRVAIARALAQRPRLLLCDEPTGHLDSDTSTRVLDMVDALQRRFGFTLVVATHDAEVASGLRRIVELRDGRIVGQLT